MGLPLFIGVFLGASLCVYLSWPLENHLTWSGFINVFYFIPRKLTLK